MTANAASRCCKSSELQRDCENNRATQKETNSRPRLAPAAFGRQFFVPRAAVALPISIAASQFEILLQEDDCGRLRRTSTNAEKYPCFDGDARIKAKCRLPAKRMPLRKTKKTGTDGRFMSDFHKYFLTNIFEGLEEREDAKKDPFDIMALGEKVRLAKSANIDAMAFLEKCHDSGLTIPQSLAALDKEIAKTPRASAASGPAKS
jgi:hypothetical protein